MVASKGGGGCVHRGRKITWILLGLAREKEKIMFSIDIVGLVKGGKREGGRKCT